MIQKYVEEQHTDLFFSPVDHRVVWWNHRLHLMSVNAPQYLWGPQWISLMVQILDIWIQSPEWMFAWAVKLKLNVSLCCDSFVYVGFSVSVSSQLCVFILCSGLGPKTSWLLLEKHSLALNERFWSSRSRVETIRPSMKNIQSHQNCWKSPLINLLVWLELFGCNDDNDSNKKAF